MRIGIIGLGAIGGVLAARLLASRRQGEEIVLAAGRSANAIREKGLRIEDEPAVLPPVVVERLDGPPYDVILLCTRTDDIEVALAPAASLLAADGTIVCIQNGLPEERAARIVGKGRVLGAVIGWSASAKRPGEYKLTGGGKFTLGAADAAGESRVAAVAALLERAFPVKRTANLMGARWSKLAMNCALSTLGAVSGFDFGGLAASRDARELAIVAVREAVQVARAKKVRLERIAGLDPSWVIGGGPLAHLIIRLAARLRPRQRSGMLVRLLEGRPAGQVDDLNGAVVRAGREAGVATPLNARLVDLVHGIERGEERLGPHQLAKLRTAFCAPR
jgi:2-dehydropantoate 2-reductase